MNTDGKTFAQGTWASFKAALSWVAAKLLGPIGAVLLIVVALVLVSMGFKELQIGGLLSKLLGRKSPSTSPVDVANTVPPSRVDSTGKIIPPGTPDQKGDVQAVVVPIKDPGLFSNPTTVTFIPPGQTAPVTIDLPTGVKNSDVAQVIVVKPEVYAVTVKDDSGISAQHVDELLKKYGG